MADWTAKVVMLNDELGNRIGYCSFRIEGDKIIYDDFRDMNGAELIISDGKEITIISSEQTVI